MKIKKAGLWLMLIMGSFIATSNVNASEFTFSVNPKIPENQIDKSKSYFDLQMDQGQKQTIEVELRNDTEKDVVVETSLHRASTNLNGVVEYGKNELEKDETLKYDLADYGKVEKETTVPAKGTAVVKVNLEMPKDKFEGVIAGGLTFQEKDDQKETESSSDSKGLSIVNKFSYVVALLMRQGETDLAPDLKLLAAGPDQVNARNVINLTFQNPVADYLNQLQLEAKIYKKGKDEVLYTSSKAAMQMAPNSQFNYPVSLDGQKLEAGDYVAKVIAHGFKNDKGTYEVKISEEETAKYLNEWKFEKEFTIKEMLQKNLTRKM